MTRHLWRHLSSAALDAQADVVVAGGGLVGVACARALALAGRRVTLLEAAPALGAASRSSGVLHAGLYYRPGSLKARLCVAGQASLIAYAASRGVPFALPGKLVVATDASQLAALEALHANALACGVADVTRLSARAAHALEPSLACAGALLSPSSGTIDVQALIRALATDAHAAGCATLLSARVLGGQPDGEGGWVLRVAREGQPPEQLRCRVLVNAAGLGAHRLAASLGVDATKAPPLRFAKGSWLALAPGVPPPGFSRHIYPIPSDGGLGIHATTDLHGRLRFGPDVQWLAPGSDPEAPGSYDADAARAPLFEAAIRSYWPALPAGALVPAGAGVRPKLSGPGEAAADFVVRREAAGLLCLYGIESPGLTASLALADHVTALATHP